MPSWKLATSFKEARLNICYNRHLQIGHNPPCRMDETRPCCYCRSPHWSRRISERTVWMCVFVRASGRICGSVATTSKVSLMLTEKESVLHSFSLNTTTCKDLYLLNVVPVRMPQNTYSHTDSIYIYKYTGMEHLFFHINRYTQWIKSTYNTSKVYSKHKEVHTLRCSTRQGSTYTSQRPGVNTTHYTPIHLTSRPQQNYHPQPQGSGCWRKDVACWQRRLLTCVNEHTPGLGYGWFMSWRCNDVVRCQDRLRCCS